jgi:asparagine synthetase B (glutamine-hydrolysing)
MQEGGMKKKDKEAMKLLHHRESDEDDIYMDENVAFVHKRLSIADLERDAAHDE